LCRAPFQKRHDVVGSDDEEGCVGLFCETVEGSFPKEKETWYFREPDIAGSDDE